MKFLTLRFGYILNYGSIKPFAMTSPKRTFMRLGMSVVGGKADVLTHPSTCLLLATNGH